MAQLDANFSFEKATKADDIARIAKYIHLTDPYIYPAICLDPMDLDWQQFIAQCFSQPNNLFSADHIFTAKHRGEIIGIACMVPCGVPLQFHKEFEIPYALQAGFDQNWSGYFCPLLEETKQTTGYNLTNICIDEAYRGKGIGAKLLEYCIDTFSSHTIHLDVIEENKNAVTMYEAHGFTATTRYQGFAGGEKILPCLHMTRQPNLVL